MGLMRERAGEIQALLGLTAELLRDIKEVSLPSGGLRILGEWDSRCFTDGPTVPLAWLHRVAVIRVASVSVRRHHDVPMRLHHMVARGLGQRRSRRNGAEQDGNRKDGGEFAEHLCFSFQS